MLLTSVRLYKVKSEVVMTSVNILDNAPSFSVSEGDDKHHGISGHIRDSSLQCSGARICTNIEGRNMVQDCHVKS